MWLTENPIVVENNLKHSNLTRWLLVKAMDGIFLHSSLWSLVDFQTGVKIGWKVDLIDPGFGRQNILTDLTFLEIKKLSEYRFVPKQD